MHPAKSWYLQQMGMQAAAGLAANGFDAVYVANAAAAKAAVLERIPKGASIGFGTSMTLLDIDLLPALQTGDYELINPPGKKLPDDKAERDALRRRAVQADVGLASANAITLDGAVVSTEGTGNRLVLYLFGPKQTILVVGANKVVSDVAEAEKHIREFTAPANAKRLDRKTPCTVTGICDDEACTTLDRVCNATLILHKKPGGVERFSIIVVGEVLGF